MARANLAKAIDSRLDSLLELSARYHLALADYSRSSFARAKLELEGCEAKARHMEVTPGS